MSKLDYLRQSTHVVEEEGDIWLIRWPTKTGDFWYCSVSEHGFFPRAGPFKTLAKAHAFRKDGGEFPVAFPTA